MQTRRVITLTAVALIAGAALAGCSSSSEGSDAAGTSTEPAEAPTSEEPAPSEPAGLSADCIPVDRAMIDGIVSGAQDGTGMQGVSAAAVKSPNFENVYFISVEFSATGVDNQVGVWASNSLTPGEGLILSASSMAKQFTVWPDAASTDAQISPTDPSIAAAEACLQ